MRGFVSYAHDDHAAFVRLMVHLKALEKAFGISFWHDTRINPGDYWTGKIAAAINEACVHVLLVSPDFIASDYIFLHELPAIAAKYASGDLVLPVVVKRCTWEAFLGPLQVAPRASSGRLVPISEWRPQDHGFDAARKQLMNAIEAHFGIKPLPGLSWKRA